MKKYLKLITVVIIVSLISTMLTGCNEINKAESAVNNMFTAFKALDFEAASEYINIDEIVKSDKKADGAYDLDNETFMKNLFGKLEYEIISSEKIDNSNVVVKTKITAIDMKPVLTEYIGKLFQFAFSNAFANPQLTEEESNKKVEELFVECVSKEDLAMVTNEVDIKVVKVDNKWKIESSEDFSDALLGGFVKAAEELSESLNKAN